MAITFVWKTQKDRNVIIKQKSAEGISLETLAIVCKGVPTPTLFKAPTPCPACPAFFM